MIRTKIILIPCIIICGLLIISPNTLCDEITNFGSEADIEYILKIDQDEEIGLEATGYFTIGTHRGLVKEASLNIEGKADKNGNYLRNPKLDIGLDGDFEWEFSGQGYGEAGHQTDFSTGRSRRLVITENRGTENSDNRTAILLPKNSQVTNASMKIEGGIGQYREDLVVGIDYYGSVFYMKSSGGSFSNVMFFKDITSFYTYGVGLGDFDNDNDLDLVSGSKLSWSAPNIDLYLWENLGGTGIPPWNLNAKHIGTISASSWNYLMDMAVEDFDNDGNLDFIGTDYGSSFYFFKGNGDLTFTKSLITSSYSGSRSYGKDAADFNNDGNMDLVSGSTSANIYYFEGLGNGKFKPEVPIPSGTTWGYQYMTVAGDFNHDYASDIITKYNYAANLIRGKGDGSFYEPVSTGITDNGYFPADNYDFNYDGKLDLVGWYRRSSSPYTFHYYYYKGNGDGTFQTPVDIGNVFGTYVYSVAAPPRMPLGGCVNLGVDIGDDGSTPEIQFNEAFVSEKTIYFKDELNALLSSANAQSRGVELVTDEYGNEMCKIPLRFESDTLGSVLLTDLDIKYTYTAKAELLPDERYNLTTDLNDLLPVDNNKSSELKVHFGIFSDTPGVVKLSDLSIEYNGAPKCKEIDTQNVPEDNVEKFMNLTKYFTDDYDSGLDMSYGIFENGDPEHLEFYITDDKWLGVDATAVPDWHGSANVRVWCRDTEGVETRSNEFKLTVVPVNDPPEAYNPLPNIDVRENTTKIAIDLDDPRWEYFIDMDSNTLYFQAILENVEEHGDQLSVDIVPETNDLRVHSIGTFQRGINVRVYCDDHASILSKSTSELESSDIAYQTILVNVTSGGNFFPPQWLDITLEPIPEDIPQNDLLLLSNYVTDADDVIGNLSYSVHSLTYSGYIDILIDEETSYLSIYPQDDFDSTAKMTLAVTDDEHNSDLITVDIKIIPSNDRPIVKISEPGNGTWVQGVVEIIGSAYDPEDELSNVEIAIGDSGSWTPVNGLGYWTYDLDLSIFTKSQTQLVVKVRAEDATGSQSISDKVYINIKHPQDDTDGDGVQDIMDKFPLNPSEWEDSDGDGFGDNQDKFPEDVTQGLDTDSDGYGDNPQGNREDKFPYDSTQWQDTDGDGHGDNDWGNNGDYYPYDPEKWRKDGAVSTGSGSDKGSGTNDFYSLTLIGLVITIMLTILILINYLVKSNKIKKKMNEKKS